MAQANVASAPDLQQRAAHYLALLHDYWRDMPAVIAAWNAEWDENDRIDFDAESFGYEDKLHSLNRLVRQGALPPKIKPGTMI